MRERPLFYWKWMGPLCLPMLLVIQPLTDYNLRTCLVLAVLSFILWVRYKTTRNYKLKSWMRSGVEKHCDKCDILLQNQISVQQDVKGSFYFYWDLKLFRGLLPWRLMSRHWGRMAQAELPPILTYILIWLYAKLFSCNLREAQSSSISSYKSLTDFFTRRLKPECRQVCRESVLVSPCDGTVTHQGTFKGGFLQQVKGVHYSLNYFLGLTSNSHFLLHAASDDCQSLLKNKSNHVLHQWVVYLSPGDYHRFHSPADWSVHLRRHFPGELLSVKPNMVSTLPGLFHLNERVAWLGEWEHGFFSMTAVGATNVGSIHSEFDPDLKTNQAISLKRECTMATGCSRRTFYYNEKIFQPNAVQLKRGQDFGHFSFGSTIVLIFEAPKDFRFFGGQGRILMGDRLAS